MMPPPAIPECPTCRQPLEYSYVTLGWQCFNSDCPQCADTVFSLAAYEADQRAKADLDSLDNAVEDDDDESEDEW